MGRATNRLTSRFVQTVKAPGRYADGAGLYLYLDKPKARGDRPAADGTKRWVFMFTWGDKRKEMGLGSAAPNAVGVAEARDLAEAARKLIRAGLNPIEERKKAPPEVVAIKTFGTVAEELIADLAGGWKNPKTADQWTSSLKQHAANLWALPVDEIGVEQVLLALRPIWLEIPETASRVRGRIEHVLDAARVGGQITGTWENPARWKGNLARLLGKRKTLSRGHFAAMPFDQMPAFMAKVRAGSSVSAAALEFTILGAARTGETIGAKGRELDMAEAVWTVPAERMKGGRVHRVPMSPRMVEIVRELWPNGVPEDGYVFPGARAGKPLSNMAMAMALDHLGAGEFTVHGFRSSFRDWAAETTNFPPNIVEAALAHLVGDETERAYRRGDVLLKRRKVMEAWAGYCARPAGGSVVGFSRPPG